MRLELLNDPAEFPGIKRAWEILCDQVNDGVTAFASYQWHKTWWQHYSAGAVLNIITMWDADRLVGIAPLMLRRATIHGIPATVVGFIENSQSLHNDFIVLPAVRELFLREVLRCLFEHSFQWEIIALKNLPGTSANYEALITILDESGKKWRQRPTLLDSPYLIPCGTWENYLAGRTSRTRKSLRHIENSMHKAGEVSVRNIRTGEEFLSVKDEVFGVAKQSWAEKNGDSLASFTNEKFFNDLALSTASRGWLSLWILELNGKMIAIEFHLKAYGKDHAMRGHYLPEFASLSPGTYLEMQILKNTFAEAERVRTYDFCGSFEEYKRKWTDSYAPHRDVEIFGDSMHARLLAIHETRLVPLLKRALPQNFWNHKLFKMCGINTKRMELK